MASPNEPKSRLRDDKEREARLANLSGAMAVARLTHQVKELELQRDKQAQPAKPTFKPFNCIIDVGVLLSMLNAVKRWSTDDGANVIVPLTGSGSARCASNEPVLDEVDKLKRGAESINGKARLAIRYLDGKTKTRSRPPRSLNDDTPSGTLRIQTSEQLFMSWEECEKLAKVADKENIQGKDIPRHFRGMINCALYQKSLGTDFTIITEDLDLISFAERWDITTMTGDDLEAEISQALERYRSEVKAYEARGRNAARHSPPQERTLWSPSQK